VFHDRGYVSPTVGSRRSVESRQLSRLLHHLQLLSSFLSAVTLRRSFRVEMLGTGNWKLEGVADSVPILGRGCGGLVEACRLPCMFQWSVEAMEDDKSCDKVGKAVKKSENGEARKLQVASPTSCPAT
jgi:hypothetical protein